MAKFIAWRLDRRTGLGFPVETSIHYKIPKRHNHNCQNIRGVEIPPTPLVKEIQEDDRKPDTDAANTVKHCESQHAVHWKGTSDLGIKGPALVPHKVAPHCNLGGKNLT